MKTDRSRVSHYFPMIEKSNFSPNFGEDTHTKWRCPHCGNRLSLDKETLDIAETAESQSYHDHVAFEPEWIELNFIARFRCTDKECGEAVAVLGEGKLLGSEKIAEDGQLYREYYKGFAARYFTPPLEFFRPPKATPEIVCSEIRESFKLIFADPPSAGTHLRVAVERLLDSLKRPRSQVVTRQKGNYRRRLSLHTRIERLPKRFDTVRSLLEAVKWIGNAGAHGSSDLNFHDVFEGYEIMEEVLNEIYLPERVKEKAKRINRRKGR